MNQTAVRVTKELHFNVPCALNKFFNKHAGTAKGGLTLSLCRFESHRKFIFSSYDPHSATAAPVGGLEHHRPSEFLRDLGCISNARHWF